MLKGWLVTVSIVREDDEASEQSSILREPDQGTGCRAQALEVAGYFEQVERVPTVFLKASATFLCRTVWRWRIKVPGRVGKAL